MIDFNCGVYQIRNSVTGKVYIGSSTNIKRRKYAHFNRLAAGKHHSRLLQRSFDKHGAGAFEFSVLSVCTPDVLLKNEQSIIDFCGASDPKLGYNISMVAGSPVVVVTEEMRKRRSIKYRSRSEKYLFNGRMMCLRDIADEVGINGSTLYNRIRYCGMSLEDALSIKVKRYKFQRIEIAGESKTAKEWCEQYGVRLSTFNSRVASGMTPHKALTTELKQTERMLSARGKTMNINCWSRESGVNASLILARIDRLGWDIDDAIFIKPGCSKNKGRSI